VSDKENDTSVKSVIDATKGLVDAVPIYPDLIQPAAKEIGAALGTVAKSVHLALAPISVMIWSYETIKDFVSNNVSERLKNVVPENIKTPNPAVAGPTLEALKYTGHEETLREMYANLLANALDRNTKNDAHPSFVEIIKQLSPEEAKLLKFLSERENYPNVCSYSGDSLTQTKHWNTPPKDYGRGIVSNQVKNEFLNVCSEFDNKIDLKTALDNLLRLQLLEVESNTSQSIKNDIRYFSQIVNNDPLSGDIAKKLILVVSYKENIRFTSLGAKFIQICVVYKA